MHHPWHWRNVWRQRRRQACRHDRPVMPRLSPRTSAAAAQAAPSLTTSSSGPASSQPRACSRPMPIDPGAVVRERLAQGDERPAGILLTWLWRRQLACGLLDQALPSIARLGWGLLITRILSAACTSELLAAATLTCRRLSLCCARWQRWHRHPTTCIMLAARSVRLQPWLASGGGRGHRSSAAALPRFAAARCHRAKASQWCTQRFKHCSRDLSCRYDTPVQVAPRPCAAHCPSQNFGGASWVCRAACHQQPAAEASQGTL